MTEDIQPDINFVGSPQSIKELKEFGEYIAMTNPQGNHNAGSK